MTNPEYDICTCGHLKAQHYASSGRPCRIKDCQCTKYREYDGPDETGDTTGDKSDWLHRALESRKLK